MIEIRNKQIIINGEPELILCGEIHYYRLVRSDWQDRIEKLKQAGCNAVATYVPWLCHEPLEGQVDLYGDTRPELDLGRFIDLCHEHGLYFFVRPGPFIMAEMKNEGIPYWVYDKHPEIIPVGWDRSPAPTPTIDYLAPNFLKEVKKWYASVMQIIEPRLHHKGGNIIAVQLDNEIGMLSWVSNTPDLTDYVLEDFSQWLNNKYEPCLLEQRYPFNLTDAAARNAHFRSPAESYSVELHVDLGYYMRARFAKYIHILRTYAEEYGVRDIPFVVNIHGTGGGRGFTFPIGISQLYEAYTQAPGYLSGSDIYFGDLNMDSFQDLYIINGFMDAVHQPDQPLTSVEFNCGDGNFGETFGGRMDVSAADLKTRMCIAQGNRLLNYYLMAGGHNYKFDKPGRDGNDRIAATGERHGFAAPISPEGELNYTFPRMAQAIQAMRAVSDIAAGMNEERDAVSFAFVPDYYMTEYCYPKSVKMQAIKQNIEANRSHDGWEIMGRAMLLAGYRFGAIDIQCRPLDVVNTPVIALPSARYLHKHVQTKLVNYMADGGSLLIYGEVPLFDMEGNPCTILADALEITALGSLSDQMRYSLSVYADGWAAPRPEVRTHHAQLFKLGRGESLFRVYGSNEVCGFEASYGSGKAIVLAMAYRCDIQLFRTALERLGVTPGLTHDNPYHGIFMTSTSNQQRERFIHILNLDGFEKEFIVTDSGRPLFEGGKITLGSRDGVMLPLDMQLRNGIRVVYSTAELKSVEDHSLTFRLTQAEDRIKLKTDRELMPNDHVTVMRDGDQYTLISRKHAQTSPTLKLFFQ